MKKIAIFAFGLIIALNMCACSCARRDTTTDPTNGTIMPTETVTVPVPQTNIPDPEVNGRSTGRNPNRVIG